MDTNIYSYEKIKIKNFLINSENYRYEPVENQDEALLTMVDEQDKKLLVLIEDIIINGLNPADLPIVKPFKNKYLVLEGNRRITALKLIATPEIIKELNYNFYKKLVKKLKQYDNIGFNEDTEIRCVSFLREEDCLKWIELKHTGLNGGKGTDSWDTISKERFKDTNMGNITLASQLINYIISNPFIKTDLKEQLPKLPSTNLTRLISDPHVRDNFGFKLESKKLYKQYPDNEISKPLSKVLYDLINNVIKVADIYSKVNRIQYLTTFKPENLPDEKQKLDIDEPIDNDRIKSDVKYNTMIKDTNSTSVKTIDNIKNNDSITPVTTTLTRQAHDASKVLNTQSTINNSNDSKNLTPKSTKRSNKNSFDRACMIPSKFNIKIGNKRINDIYKELKILKLDNFANAASVLFRVFIELSVDEFIEVYSIKIHDRDPLRVKVEKVLNHLKDKKLITDELAKPINVSISSTNNILSINTFNAYVHNKYMIPSKRELITSWDNVEGFINIMWNTINSKKEH